MSLDSITHRYVREHLDELIELNDAELADLQQCLLGMLRDIDAACRQAGIDYALTGGNVLGKVRHNGFIPWDDDVDLVMTRKDYDRFKQVFRQTPLAEKYILRAPGYDEGADFRCMKIYKKDSVMEQAFHKSNVQHKVFIDVMVLDNVPVSRLHRSLKNLRCAFLIVILGCIDIKKNFSRVMKQEMKKTWAGRLNYYFRVTVGTLFGLVPQQVWYRWYDRAPIYGKETGFSTVYNGKLLYKGEIVPTDLYLPFQDCEYCGVRTRILHEPEKYLAFRYGDYMKMPDRSQRETHIVKHIDTGRAEV